MLHESTTPHPPLSLPLAHRLAAVLPGIGLCAVIAVIATALNMAVPLISPMLVAILAGVLMRNLRWIPAWAEMGVAYSARTILRAGVVLLGLRLSLPAVVALGWQAVVVIVLTVASIFAITLLLGRAMHVPRMTALLTATGTAICGAAAVAGMSAAVRPRDGESEEDIDDAAATAIASVTLFGTAAILVIPAIARAMGLDAMGGGVLAGASIHEVGQVVAAGGLISTAALDVAVVAKLGRVVLLAPLVALVGYLEQRHARSTQGPIPATVHRTPIVPLFVVGFLAAVIFRSVTTGMIPDSFFHAATQVAGFLLAMAMCGMGAGVRLSHLAATGMKALGLGAIAGVVSVVIALLGVLVLL